MKKSGNKSKNHNQKKGKQQAIIDGCGQYFSCENKI